MPSRILAEEARPTELYLLAHIDESRLDEAGEPDPEWLTEFRWGVEPPAGQTAEEYRTNIRREIGLLCEGMRQRREAL